MDQVAGQVLVGSPLNGTITSTGILVIPGVSSNTRNAVLFDGATYAGTVANSNGLCLCNLEKCTDGITIAAWLKVGTKASQSNEWYYMTTGGHTKNANGWVWFQRYGKLNFVTKTRTKKWPASEISLAANEWKHVLTSWHGIHGTKVYVDFKQVDSQSGASTASSPNTVYDLKIGMGSSASDVSRLGNFTIDDLQIWYKSVTTEILQEIQLKTFF